MDLFSRAILGALLAPTLEAQHALATLQQAQQQARSDLRGLTHHSDHGVQYTSHDHQDWLGAHGIAASMGEVGNRGRRPRRVCICIITNARIKRALTLTRWTSIRGA